MNFEDYQYLLKIVLIGGKGVGKSCFLSQYVKGEYDFTIELELERKSIEFDDGIAVQNQLWDTLTIIILISQEVLNLSQCRKTFCQNAAPDIIFYSINSQSSFNSLLKLFEILAKVQSDQFQTVIVATQEEDQKSYLFLKRLPIQQEPNFLKSPIMTKIKLMQFLILYLTMSCNQYIPIKSIHQKLTLFKYLIGYQKQNDLTVAIWGQNEQIISKDDIQQQSTSDKVVLKLYLRLFGNNKNKLKIKEAFFIFICCFGTNYN